MIQKTIVWAVGLGPEARGPWHSPTWLGSPAYEIKDIDFATLSEKRRKQRPPPYIYIYIYGLY